MVEDKGKTDTACIKIILFWNFWKSARDEEEEESERCDSYSESDLEIVIGLERKTKKGERSSERSSEILDVI